MTRLVRIGASKMLAAASALLPPHLSRWSRAMERELAEIDDDPAAAAFALDCVRAIFALAISARFQALLAAARAEHFPLEPSTRSLPAMNSLSTRPRLIGLLCGAGAVGLGMAYMFAAGAPSSYLLMNLAALILGASLWLALGRAAASGFSGAGAAICAMALVLLGTALLGTPVDGAARWIKIGPLGLQVSLILLPAMLVLYARRPGLLGTAGMLVAAVALAAQPDRAMAGVLTAALLVLAVAKPARSTAAAAAGAALAFGWTWLMPDRLPAVPFVDRILYTSFDVHPLAGVAVVAGAAALLIPGLAAWRDGGDRPALLAFGACWAAAIAAAAIGDYPTPLVGYGGSAVLGYLLSVALLPGRIEETSARGGPASRGGAERAAPCEVAELYAATPA